MTAALSSAITFVITKQGAVNVSGDEKFSKLMVRVYEGKDEYYEKRMIKKTSRWCDSRDDCIT
ncbi:hypothetical protein ACEQPO_16500 [Bacillus sp. SL00103]